jgi:hypothetical protein
MSSRFARFLLLFAALWLPVQTMAAMAMPQCRHTQEQVVPDVATELSTATHCHEAAAADQAVHDAGCDNCEICHLACAGFMPSAAAVAGVIPMVRSYAALPIAAPPSYVAEPPQHPPRNST